MVFAREIPTFENEDNYLHEIKPAWNWCNTKWIHSHLLRLAAIPDVLLKVNAQAYLRITLNSVAIYVYVYVFLEERKYPIRKP